MLITLLLAWQTAQMGSVEGVVRNSATGAGVARAVFTSRLAWALADSNLRRSTTP